MKLLLVEQDLMRSELAQRRAEVQQISVMEAETRRAMEFWRREAERMASREATLIAQTDNARDAGNFAQWVWHFLFRLKSRLIALGAHR
jgi:hypothetical protein